MKSFKGIRHTRMWYVSPRGWCIRNYAFVLQCLSYFKMTAICKTYPHTHTHTHTKWKVYNCVTVSLLSNILTRFSIIRILFFFFFSRPGHCFPPEEKWLISSTGLISNGYGIYICLFLRATSLATCCLEHFGARNCQRISLTQIKTILLISQRISDDIGLLEPLYSMNSSIGCF